MKVKSIFTIENTEVGCSLMFVYIKKELWLTILLREFYEMISLQACPLVNTLSLFILFKTY